MAAKVRNKECFLGWSIGLSIILCLVCYLTENVPFALWDGLDKFFFLERGIQKTIGPKEKLDDAFFVNVGYDKDVVDIALQDSLFFGKIDITNRQTLDNFLERLEKEDVYKYIFLDVRFEAGINTPYDSSLFHRIARMRDIVVATHRNIELASPLLADKVAVSDYKTTVTSTGFTRYQFLQKGQPSVPLKIYEDETGKTIKQLWKLPFYFSGCAPCKNALFIRIPADFSQETVSSKGRDNFNISKKRFFDCGPEIDEDFDLKENVEGKYVIIGDFVSDNASTYMGEQPNPYLAYLAMKNLMEGRHKINWWFVFFLIVLFSILFYSMLKKKENSSLTVSCVTRMVHWVQKRRKREGRTNRGWRWVGLFFGYTLDLYVVCILAFLFFHITFCIWIPSLTLSLFANSIEATKDVKQASNTPA